MQVNEQMIWSYITEYYIKYKRFVMPAALAISFIIGVIIYAFLSRGQYQEAAQQALAEALVEYDRAYTNPDSWADIEFGGRTGYAQFSRSSLAPYFKAVQADALLAQNNMQEALQVMKEVVSSTSKSSPLFYLYKVKYARMQLDSGDQAVIQEGKQALKALAYDQQNPQRDQALYYLALFYEVSNEKDASFQTWQDLASIKQKNIISPWITLAQDTLSKVDRDS